MTVDEPHRTTPSVPAAAPGHPIAGAAAGALLAACIYHIIPGGAVADDALRAVCAALACALALACLRRDARRAEKVGACALALGGLALWAIGLLACGAADADAAAGSGAGTAMGTGLAGTVGAWAVLAASCLGTAVWEETLFRRLLPDAFATQLGSAPVRRLLGAVICSALFGLLHLGGATGVAANGVADAAALGAMMGRFAQTALFGLIMAGVVTCRGGLLWAIALHGTYDLVGFAVGASQGASGLGIGPGFLAQPAESLLSAFVTPEALAASIAVFIPLAVWSCTRLLRGR